MTSRRSRSSVRVVLAFGSLASYPQGGGHWTCPLQYLFGLDALGHDVFWLELLKSTGDEDLDHQRIRLFFRRFKFYGFEDRCALLLYDPGLGEPTLESARAYGMSGPKIREVAQSADVVWNFSCGLRKPLLSLFRRRVLLDLDPGILQVSAHTYDMELQEHHAFFSVGTKLRDADCEVPTLGLPWQPFMPVVYLPMWDAAPDPGPRAPFSSLVHWTWGEIWLQDRAFSMAKRDAYLRYADLPGRAGRSFELAAKIYADDESGDRDLMLGRGWKLVDPYEVAGSPSAYRGYIKRSRAEIACPKPIYRELKSGWFSDRSACYLASGRPVLAEDTGFSEHLPTGRGLVAFRDMEEALAGVADIDANYERHSRAARELAEEFLDSRRCLEVMLSVCG
jgi:hypothetical protein